MRQHPHPLVAALVIFAAPQVATPQASEACCQVNSPATAKPSQPVSTVRGSDKAPITILVFSDFESFPCARSASVIDGLLQQTRDVRVIFKHAPAASNPNALLAHEAALAAGEPGDRRDVSRFRAALRSRRRLANRQSPQLPSFSRSPISHHRRNLPEPPARPIAPPLSPRVLRSSQEFVCSSVRGANPQSVAS